MAIAPWLSATVKGYLSSDSNIICIFTFDRRMASKISREWQLKRENGIKYRVVIKNYLDEIDNLSCMRTVKSSKFKIGESTFRIILEPDTQHCDVGVFLENLNPWKVNCTWSIRAGSEILEKFNKFIRANSTRGYHPEFLDFQKIYKGGILDDDGDLTIEVNVKLLGEEVIPSSRDEVGGPTLSMMQDQLDKVTEDLADMKALTQNMFGRVMHAINDVKELKAQLRCVD